jgi:multidrug efflux system membrane fusion protein
MPSEIEPPNPRTTPAAPAFANASRSRRWLVIAVLVALAAAGAWYLWHALSGNVTPPTGATSSSPGAVAPAGPGGGRFDPNAKPAPVAVVTAKAADFPVYLSALGTVTPLATVTVHSRVDGPLQNIYFKEGDLVKAGQVLAEIDPRTFAVMVAQADGTLQKDRALLENARTDLKRYQTLLAQDSIASQQVDTQASLVNQYIATIASDQGQLDAAKLQLTFTKITAPISGRLGLRQVDVGNMVHASDTNGIVVITQLQPIDVVYAIPEVNVPKVMGQLRDGKTLAVDAWNRDQTAKLASGQVLTIDNQIDVTTGTVKMKARFANGDFSLFPNQFVNIRMLVETLPQATVVPSAAVQRGTQGTFVYLVDANSVVSIKVVKVGPVDGESTVISRGVQPGDVVVIDGTDRLREGQKVETVSRDTSVAPTGARRGRQGGGGGGGGAAAGGAGGGNGVAGKGDGSGRRRRAEGTGDGTAPAGTAAPGAPSTAPQGPPPGPPPG